MAQTLYWNGFRLPLAITFGPPTEGPRDGHPSPGFCVLCKRKQQEVYDYACRGCVADTARYARSIRRPRALLPERPVENVGGGPALDPAIWGHVG